MEGKVLGKITSAEFGNDEGYPFLMGLKLQFKFDDNSGVGDGGCHTVNMNEECKWEGLDRNEEIAKRMIDIHQLLKKAKVSNVSQLKNIPVEIELKNNTFKGFRILTEVL